MKSTITTKQVSSNRPRYYNVLINGKKVSEIRYPSNNPYLIGKTLQEIAEIESNRIINN